MPDDPRPAPASPVLELQRAYPVSCERLYRCFTVAEELTRWFGPAHMSCPRAAVDARPDGRYRIELASADGAAAVVAGRFVEVDPPHRICMTWAWEQAHGEPGDESLVTVRFEPAPEGTLLTLRHERLATPEARKGHREGWESSFDCLARHLSTPAPAADRA